MFTSLFVLLAVRERLNYVGGWGDGKGKIVLTFLGNHFELELSALLQYKFILLVSLAIYTTALKGRDTSYIF
jgi:hypothetical protein